MTFPTDGMVLMYVPGGTFKMGGYLSSVQLVTLSAFWIDRTEVTNAQFTEFVMQTGYLTDAEKAGTSWVSYTSGANGSEVQGANWRHPRGPNDNLDSLDNHPVVQVSWNDALAYCRWAGRQLPTEAQWEYAMRGPRSYIYPWGNDDPNPETLNYNWFVGHTTAVGTYPRDASWVGALDMAGNVTEWVNDWDPGPYPPNASQPDPTGPVTGTKKITRGGWWSAPSGGAQGRYYYNLDARHEELGFRCALAAGE